MMGTETSQKSQTSTLSCPVKPPGKAAQRTQPGLHLPVRNTRDWMVRRCLTCLSPFFQLKEESLWLRVARGDKGSGLEAQMRTEQPC